MNWDHKKPTLVYYIDRQPCIVYYPGVLVKSGLIASQMRDYKPLYMPYCVRL